MAVHWNNGFKRENKTKHVVVVNIIMTIIFNVCLNPTQ